MVYLRVFDVQTAEDTRKGIKKVRFQELAYGPIPEDRIINGNDIHRMHHVTAQYLVCTSKLDHTTPEAMAHLIVCSFTCNTAI